MQYDFETLTDRRGAGAAKWDMMYAKKKNVGEGIVPLSVADMEFSIAPEIRAALAAYVQEQIPGYAAAPEGFAESVCAFLRRRHGIEAAPEELIQTPGVVYALPRAIRALTEAGDGVILFTPVYYPFYRAVRHAGREIRSCPLRYENGRYSIDFDLFERLAAEERTTALLLCSPHNPVGRAWTKEELERIGRICIDNGVMIAVDEIHSDLVYAPHKHIPFAAISEEFAQHSIICTSPSKTFNLAGLLVSDIIIPSDSIRAAFREKMEPYYLWPGNFGSVAQIAAYNESEDWLEELLAYLKGNAEFLAEFLAQRMPQVKYQIPEATYLAWLDFRALGLSNEELWDLMIHKAKVATDNGPMFGLHGEGDGFQRLNFACSRARLTEALNRIADAVDALQKSK